MTTYRRATLKSGTVVTVEDGWYGGPFAIVWQDVPGKGCKPNVLNYRTFKRLDVAQEAFQRLVARNEARS